MKTIHIYTSFYLKCLLTAACCIAFHACHPDHENLYPGYSTSGHKIYNEYGAIQLIGANAFHIFGAGSRDMNSWKMDISREFIGNMKQAPVSGSPILDNNGAYLHSMQAVADSNRLHKRVTVFCAFGWDGTPATVFSGLRPPLTAWWTDYKSKLREWAIQFKDQSDVWIEPWNEPYRYDRNDGYSDEIWMNDMTEMVDVIRGTGNKNIILIPGAEQGQDESVLLNKGSLFLLRKQNILYDIHAYEKWLLASPAEIDSRLTLLNNYNLPVIFGETAPMNAGVLMNPQVFLNAAYNKGFSVCAWTWKYDDNDQDALLTGTGLPNDNNNNNWGSFYRSLAARTRKP